MEGNMKEPTDIEPIDYRVHETALARLEKINKRLFILCIIVFFAFVISNGAWIYYENQFEDIQTSVTQQVDSASGNAIIHGTYAGAVIDGKGKAKSNN